MENMELSADVSVKRTLFPLSFLQTEERSCLKVYDMLRQQDTLILGFKSNMYKSLEYELNEVVVHVAG